MINIIMLTLEGRIIQKFTVLIWHGNRWNRTGSLISFFIEMELYIQIDPVITLSISTSSDTIYIDLSEFPMLNICNNNNIGKKTKMIKSRFY